MKFKSPLGSLLSAAAMASALSGILGAEEPEHLAPVVEGSARRAMLVAPVDAGPTREVLPSAAKEPATDAGVIRRGIRLARSRFDPPGAQAAAPESDGQPPPAGRTIVSEGGAADASLGDESELLEAKPIPQNGRAAAPQRTSPVGRPAATPAGTQPSDIGGTAGGQVVGAGPSGLQGAAAPAGQEAGGLPSRLIPPANASSTELRAGENANDARVIPLGPGSVAAPPPAPNGQREVISTPPPANSDELVSEPTDETFSASPQRTVAGGETSYFTDDFWEMTNRWVAPGFFTGAQLTMLSPMGEDRPAVTLTDLVSQQTWTNDANSPLATGVRTWAGFQTPNALGFRVTYWTMGNDLANPEPVVPYLSKPATIDVFHLRAQTLDVEMINSFCFGRGLLDVSLGARYATLDRNLTALGFGDVGGPNVTPVSLYGLANVSNSISGTGFTASIGGRRPIGTCDPIANFANRCGPAGWSVFWNVRGSVLWGESSANARTEAHAITKFGGGSTSFDNQASYACSDSDTLKIGDLQLGLAYQRALRCRPGVMTFQVALEGQTWSAGNAAAQAESNAFLAGGPPLFGGQASARAYSEAGGLNLLGITLGVGLSF